MPQLYTVYERAGMLVLDIAQQCQDSDAIDLKMCTCGTEGQL